MHFINKTAAILSGHINLANLLSTPNVSTVPTPDIQTTANVATQIDSATRKVNRLQNNGLVPPSVHKPAVGVATGTAAHLRSFKTKIPFVQLAGFGRKK
jgi:hypothetical protein